MNKIDRTKQDLRKAIEDKDFNKAKQCLDWLDEYTIVRQSHWGEGSHDIYK